MIKGATEEEIWQQLKEVFEKEEIQHYSAIIEQEGQRTILDIDIDLGGGFESGYATTILMTPVPIASNFRFMLRRQNILQEVGKLLGMQDVTVGDREFDDHFIIKAMDEAKIRLLFSEKAVRDVLRSLPGGVLQLEETTPNNEQIAMLTLTIEEGITNPEILQNVYHAFYLLTKKINSLMVDS